MYKTCRTCKVNKHLADFYQGVGMKDGYVNHCKECQKAQIKQYRKDHDHVRTNDRNRQKGKSQPYSRAYELANPIKYRARTALNNAVGDGKLNKPDTCSECNATGVIYGHHDDYKFPLVVRWLCARCHSLWHAENGEGLNG